MAIDSRNKRAACLGLAAPYRPVLPNPDIEPEGLADRQQFVFLYPFSPPPFGNIVTREKRASCIGLVLPSSFVFPNPDFDPESLEDRQQFASLYSGILVGVIFTAINTREKRASCIGLILPCALVLPNPDMAAEGLADRQNVAALYSGILVGVVVIAPQLINTRDKRASCIGLIGPYRFIMPNPDIGIENEADRQQFAFLYRSITIGEHHRGQPAIRVI